MYRDLSGKIANFLKKVPAWNPTSKTCHYTNDSFLQLKEFITIRRYTPK
jgi:hypothetical protein